MFFEDLGFTYIGPVDGHDITSLVEILEKAKELQKPVLVHVVTKKGLGYKPAEQNPDEFHGTGPFDIATGHKIAKPNAAKTYTQVFSETLLTLAAKNKQVVALTAAMPGGTGLTPFAKAYPTRFFDVGIAEQHAVTMAAGMACGGLKPVVVLYSTFCQRAYDQVLHDVCLQNLPVVFCLDRAGLVGDDGNTHHGVFDYSFMRMLPNMTIMAPKDENELRHMLYTALAQPGPITLRYPRGSGLGVNCSEQLTNLSIGKAEILKEGRDIYLWAIGSMVAIALEVATILAQRGISAGVVNARFVKPLDSSLLRQTASTTKRIATLEENVLVGGFGEAVLESLNKQALLTTTKVLNFGIDDVFVPHGKREYLLKDLTLDAAGIADKIFKTFRD